MIGLLAASSLTFGLSASLATSAQAADTLPTFVEFEIFPADILVPGPSPAGHHICVDDNGSNVIGEPIILWHCNSGVNQEWQVRPSDDINDPTGYQFQNRTTRLCLIAPNGLDGTFVRQGTCDNPNGTDLSGSKWHVNGDNPLGGGHLSLVNATFNVCMAAANSSGNDGTHLVTQTCNPTGHAVGGENELQAFALG
jgi:hypothetical protein